MNSLKKIFSLMFVLPLLCSSLWCMERNTVIKITKFFDCAPSEGMSPDGTLVLTGGRNGTLYLWDTKTELLLKELEIDTQWLISGSFSPDSKKILTGSADGTLCLWSVETKTLLAELGRPSTDIISAAFSSDSTKILITSKDGNLWWWDIETSKFIIVEELEKLSQRTLSAPFDPYESSLISPMSPTFNSWWNPSSPPNGNIDIPR